MAVKRKTTGKADMGLVGLAVMGENLILNMESKGFTVACYNRTTSKVDDFIAGRAKGKKIIGCRSEKRLCAALKRPRKVMIMVKAGAAVDTVIDQLLPHLQKGDIIIDGGNSHFPDTIRRTAYVESKGLLYIGTGVSGGEEGALLGPSIMPGGSKTAWRSVKRIFQKIAAHTAEGDPCCDWVGENGAGHFVKMVHNGIEYGLMEAYAEGFELMKAKSEYDLDLAGIAEVWRYGSVIRSWLLDLAAAALREDPMLEGIQAYVEDTGEGRWTVQESIDLAVPVPAISQSLQARFRSRQEQPFGGKLLAALRKQFGGHVVREAPRREG